MTAIRCTGCGSEWPQGQRFCGSCGLPLLASCPACGTSAAAPDQRFCGGCGAPLRANGEEGSAGRQPSSELPSERRLVSVVFADLAGFTPFSEARDAEEVREVLEEYFAVCCSAIEHHGGTVQKYIGDAVMAVWGTPQAREDDAERAVRAGLALTSTVAALGERLGTKLQVRVGVLTGEAAVRVGAEQEGLVVGDSVNTAARVQSAAEPGSVLVDEATRRAAEAAIAFEEAGLHSLKGKSEPLRLWRARRVVANVGGLGRMRGPESPLTGRETQLRELIAAFEASAAEGKARLATIVGGPGLGKSRLAWELEKYVDGLRDLVLWHRGRSLSYGEGVAFWALAEMVRMRARIAEDDDADTARAKLAATLDRHVPDPGDRRLIEPRLAALLGLEGRQPSDQATLFSGWRLFIERLADEAPVVLVFEDVQRADNGVLDFIDYVLEWSSERPIFMVVLARPELAERRPTWVSGAPAISPQVLQPLEDREMDELLDGLIEGPAAAEVRGGIRERAEGVPLYAVEIVRMLADRGLLRQQGERYSQTGPVGEIEVPETLQALIAARLDALSPEERRLTQDAAVLGMSFSVSALAAVSGVPEREAQDILEGLVAKQLLGLDADPVSPERGQYQFLQGMVRRVAYARLGRRERKQRHLRAAEHLEATFGPEAIEIADMLASHYLDAAAADPAAADVEEITARARRTEIAAGERAARLAAGEQASAYFAQAAERTAAPLERAELLDRSGQAAVLAGDLEDAQERFEAAIGLLEKGGEQRTAAVVSARLADIAEFEGRLQEARERLEAAYATLREGEPGAELAEIAYKLAARQWEAGEPGAAERLELALEIAERLRLPDTLAAALNAKWFLLTGRGRNHEGLAVLKYALDLAVEHGLDDRAMRTHNNLAMHLAQLGRREEAIAQAKAGLTLARRLGDRLFEAALLANMPLQLFRLGRWDEALEIAARLPGDRADAIARVEALLGTLLVKLAGGERAQAEQDLVLIEALAATADRPEMLTIVSAARTAALAASGDDAAALRAAEPNLLDREEDQFIDSPRLELFVSALEAALGSGELDKAGELLTRGRSWLERIDCPYLAAQVQRFDARMAARAGDTTLAEAGFERAVASLRELSDPFALGIVLLERAQELPEASAGDAWRREARGIFERLGAAAWLERMDAPSRPVGVA